MIQHRLVWSTEAAQAEAVQDFAGRPAPKRLFSKQALANFVKGLLKLAVVGTVLVALMWPERYRLESLVGTDVASRAAAHPDAVAQLLAPWSRSSR